MSIGRLLRDKMRDLDTPERVAERIKYRLAGEQAHREMLAQFSPLTTENALAAIKWQELRIKELLSDPVC